MWGKKTRTSVFAVPGSEPPSRWTESSTSTVQGRVFMMREWLELETEEICKTLTITPTNLWVMLHRARQRLRECLQTRWFDGRPAATRKA